jgi:hypothetical protein
MSVAVVPPAKRALIRGPQNQPKISTRVIIREVARHTGTEYDTVADVVYAFLSYVRYAAMVTDERVVMRGFGAFYPAKIKGRTYGGHLGLSVYHPDRIKLGITSPSLERDKWKNTLLIQKSVASALDAELKPYSMDLSICARIADLVLSNKPINVISGQDKIEFIRQWIYATGASPLLPSANTSEDRKGRKYGLLKFRMSGQTVRALVFDFEPDILFLNLVVKSKRDVVFLRSGWIPGVRVQNVDTDTLPIHDYGRSPEDLCRSMYLAYKMTKYGDAAPQITDTSDLSGDEDSE